MGQKTPSTRVLDVVFERQFRSREQAHSDIRFADCGKATSYRIAELSRHQFVFEFRGSRSDVVQTVVTHRMMLLML
jgi:hypothetical protein